MARASPLLTAALAATVLLGACQVLAPPARPAAAPAPPDAPVDRADAWEDVWQTLERRPLRLPAVAAGGACPVSSAEPIVGRHGLGNGPVYPVGHPQGVVRYGDGQEQNGWRIAKVLWLASPWYRGPSLVRGRQVDGPNELRFPLAVQNALARALTGLIGAYAVGLGVVLLIVAGRPDERPRHRGRPSAPHQ